MPSQVDLGGGIPKVQWQDFAEANLNLPFYRNTVDTLPDFCTKVQHSASSAPRLRENVPPTAFIAHVGRCGSTLLSNMLKQVRSIRVISEPQPFRATLMPVTPINWFMPYNSAAVARHSLLKTIIAAFGQHAEQPSNLKYLFIKLTSWNVFDLHTIRELWPNTKLFFVFRDPIEVLVSCLNRPPGWLSMKEDPALVARMFGWHMDSRNFSDIEFFAKMIGSFYQKVLDSKALDVHLLHYPDIVNMGVKSVLNRCGIVASELELAEMDLQTTSHSKGFISGTFTEDSQSKRADASEDVTRHCNTWARPQYEQLLAHYTHGNNAV